MLLVPARYFYLRPLFILFDVYMMLIAAGIIASLDAYPHTIKDGQVTLRQGWLKSVAFERDDVLDTKVYGTEVSRSQLRAIAGSGAAFLLTAGAPTLCIRLRSPVDVHTIFGTSKPASVLYVSVDEPRALQAAVATPAT